MSGSDLFGILLGDVLPSADGGVECVACVLAGELHDGAVVEIVGPTGTVTAATMRGVPAGCVTSADSDCAVVLSGFGCTEVARGAVVRAVGSGTPVLDLEGAAGPTRTRLLQAAAAARERACEAGLAAVVNALPPEAAVLFVEKRLRAAFARHESSRDVLVALSEAAEALQAIGLAEDGDRLRLVAAASLEERPLGPTMGDMSGVATMGMATVAEEFAAASEAAEFFGSLMGFEDEVFSSTFASTGRSQTRSLGEAIRIQLLLEDRAVALGWCRRCRDTVVPDERERCSHCGRRVRDIDYVVPSEAEALRTALRARHGGR